MATREVSPVLQKLRADGNTLYSYSKCNTIAQCPYQAYLTYIKRVKGTDSIYGLLGTVIHDTLEQIICGKATPQDLMPALNNELELASDFGIDFPKDMRGGTSIRDNWLRSMTHFIDHFESPQGQFTTEQLVVLPVAPKRYLQGYIDLIRRNDDGTVSVFDWKTSTQFKDAELVEHGRQLVLYALALEHQGLKVRDCAWIMLKYVQVEFDGFARSNAKQRTHIVKIMQRSKMYRDLASFVKSDMIACGYTPEMATEYTDEMIVRESLDVLPSDIRNHYKVSWYVRPYKITAELKQEAVDYVNRMADLFESKSKNASDWPPTEITKANSFFCNSLCSYGKICPYIRRYNQEFAEESFV